jgi:hypothetical protein
MDSSCASSPTSARGGGSTTSDVGLPLWLLSRQSFILSDVLLKPNGYPFGHQTISAVLGANLVRGTLSRTGTSLQRLLDYIEEDHCLKAYYNIKTP